MIERLNIRSQSSNCYFFVCEETGKAAIIDPGAVSDTIIENLKKRNLHASLIIMTHAHRDHIGAVEELRNELKLPVAIHQDDAEKFNRLTGFRPDITLQDGIEIKIGEKTVKVIHTPGHTPGGICLLTEDGLLSGDTLFYGTVGRADLEGGNARKLLESLHNKLMALDDEILVFPGHGQPTSIGRERRFNPFISL